MHLAEWKKLQLQPIHYLDNVWHGIYSILVFFQQQKRAAHITNKKENVKTGIWSIIVVFG